MRTIVEKRKAADKFESVVFQHAPQRLETFIKSYSEHCINALLSNYAYPLLNTQFEIGAQNVLIEIWQRGLRLFIQLQTQMSNFRWHKPEHGRMLNSNYDSKLMVLHRCQTYIKQHERQVGLILSPLIYVEGDEDGQNYDNPRRILVPAMVLVLDKADGMPSQYQASTIGVRGDAEGESQDDYFSEEMEAGSQLSSKARCGSEESDNFGSAGESDEMRTNGEDSDVDQETENISDDRETREWTESGSE